MWCRGIRGATIVASNSKESIVAATKELLQKMVESNDVETDMIAAVLFTTTPDLNAEFPAAAARQLGWPSQVALLDGHEMSVPHDLARCLRILMLVNTDKRADEIVHVYLGEAESLRQDK